MTQWNLSALCTSIHHAKERIQDIDSLVQQAKQLDIRTQLPVFLETLERIYTLQLQVSAYAHLRQSLNSTDEAINAFLSQLDQHSVAWSDALL
ncbi:MAG: hypothetical protein ACMXYC_02300, partial [Candidatus Woesearchaeota archaeon]